MEIQHNSQIRLRSEKFGGICYIPHRDDFFAISKDVYELVSTIPTDWSTIPANLKPSYAALAKLGICKTRNPVTREISYSGPSFIGKFREIVTVPEPLVLNCFSTAYCPLKCVYCHADDLMQDFRDLERDEDVENVATTASLVPAMVAVITGGDPLTKPERAAILIERLASQKALVLDTSGVGDIDKLLPMLKKYNVHIRVSLDAVSDINQKLRIPNKKVVTDPKASFNGASYTIKKCLDENIAVTVQTVVTAMNDNPTELINLRDWIVDLGVRHWVLHITIKGGSARRIEDRARRQKRPKGILPSADVYQRIKSIINDSIQNKVPIDIRCTDTDNTPNSVLLIGSNGDLYTEGLAHNGKVRLFTASEARPDLIREFWYHIDSFGHTRRYLNWNPGFYEGSSLEELCYQVPLPESGKLEAPGVIEIEAKYQVADIEQLRDILAEHAEKTEDELLQRDEYYDTKERVLNSQDFVVRVRKTGDYIEISLKGARFRTPTGEYSRVELEFASKSEDQLKEEISKGDLECTWFFEKRRTEYTWKDLKSAIVVDEVPEIGFFIEIEGSLQVIRKIEKVLSPALGAKERRNYKELFVDFKQSSLGAGEEINGAEF